MMQTRAELAELLERSSKKRGAGLGTVRTLLSVDRLIIALDAWACGRMAARARDVRPDPARRDRPVRL